MFFGGEGSGLRILCGDLAGGTGRKGNLGQAEIQNLRASALGYENVCGFDVPMHDILRMSGVQGVGNLNRQAQQNIGPDGPSADALLQRKSIQKLHGDERRTVLVVNFVNGANIGMIQCRGRLGFTLKAGQGLRVSRYVVGQEFKRDKAAELHVFGFVDHTHPAVAELLCNAVVRDGFADQGKRPALWRPY